MSRRVILPSWMWAMRRQRPPQLWAGHPVLTVVSEQLSVVSWLMG